MADLPPSKMRSDAIRNEIDRLKRYLDGAEFIYVGIRQSDGSIRATCCDDAGAEEDTAEKVADWIRRGLIVKRLSDEEFRAALSSSQRDVSVAPVMALAAIEHMI